MIPTNNPKKIFVSYKYKDPDVHITPISKYTPGEDTDFLYTPRHYVDRIIEVVGSDNIYKGELGDEGMDDLSEDTIDSELKRKIFDSSVTIVLISPNMWDKTKLEKDQWIPREIIYSMRNKTRGDKSSKTNGMLAVVLPNLQGKYDYAVTRHTCPFCNVTIWHTDKYFSSIAKNMFNRDEKNLTSCNSCYMSNIHTGHDHSYMYPVVWDAFINDHNTYIDHALFLRDQMDDFDLKKDHV